MTCVLKKKICGEKECERIATFNYTDYCGVAYCSLHKKEGMIRKYINKITTEGQSIDSYNVKRKKYD
jgi:hypothetical protein